MQAFVTGASCKMAAWNVTWTDHHWSHSLESIPTIAQRCWYPQQRWCPPAEPVQGKLCPVAGTAPDDHPPRKEENTKETQRHFSWASLKPSKTNDSSLHKNYLIKASPKQILPIKKCFPWIWLPNINPPP